MAWAGSIGQGKVRCGSHLILGVFSAADRSQYREPQGCSWAAGRLQLGLHFLESDQRTVEILGVEEGAPAGRGRRSSGLPSPRMRAPPTEPACSAAASEIGNLETDMVHAARGVGREELRDGRVLPQRMQKLDLGVFDEHEDDGDAMLGQRLPVVRLGPGSRDIRRRPSRGRAAAMATWLRRPIVCWTAFLDLVEHGEGGFEDIGAWAEDFGDAGCAQERIILLGNDAADNYGDVAEAPAPQFLDQFGHQSLIARMRRRRRQP